MILWHDRVIKSVCTMWDARQLLECLIFPCFMFQLRSHSAPGMVYLCTQMLFYPRSSSASQWHLLLLFQRLDSVCVADGALVCFLVGVTLVFAHTGFSWPNATPQKSHLGLLCTKDSRQTWTDKVTTEGERCLESVSSFGCQLLLLKEQPKNMVYHCRRFSNTDLVLQDFSSRL